MGKQSMANTKSKVSTSTKVSRTSRAGLTLEVGRVAKIIKSMNVAKRYSPNGLICLTGFIEYIASEILEVATHKCTERKRNTISNRDILMGTKADKELYNLVLGTGSAIKDAGFTSENVPVSSKKASTESQKKK